jgi:DNA polymerase-3 subunit alpha
MQFIDQFIESKHGRRKIEYPHPWLEEVLKPTYGVIVYQEQVMQVAQIIAGFSLGKADIMRRAMGKKKVKEMEKMKIDFVDGAVNKGVEKKKAEEIYEILKPFAGYGFNKSHAAAYSVLAYKTAYLKAHYPAEFMAANLTNEINSPDKFAMYLKETTDAGLPILTPDINLSEQNFTVVDKKIYYGLQGIKNVGEAAVQEIIRKRESEGIFESMLDFLEKVDLKTVNKRVLEAFIKAGLFDKTEASRAVLMHNLDMLMEYMAAKKNSQLYGQSSLFEDNEQEIFPDPVLEPAEDWDLLEQLKFEKEYLGFFFSGHPLDKYKEVWKKSSTLDLTRAESASPNKTYTLVGTIKTPKQIITKKGHPMGFASLEDYNSTIELVFFSRTWQQFQHLIREDEILGIEGKIDLKRGDPKVLVDKVVLPEELEEKMPREMHIKLEQRVNENDLYDLRNFVFTNNGRCSIYLHIETPQNDRETVIKASEQLGINTADEIISNIKKLPVVADAWRE